MTPMKPLRALGAFTLRFLEDTGTTARLLARAILSLRRRPYYLRNWSSQMLEIGNRSLPVVFVTAAFSGAVFALQVWEGFNRFGAGSLVGFAVALAMTRELIPVLAGIMVAGRAGSAMAAEIGTMVVTEQVDALETMATDPVKYIVVPRLFAGATMLPVLVIIGDVIGIWGGFVVAVEMLGLPATTYWNSAYDFLTLEDVAGGLIKSSVFGLLVALSGCTQGLLTTGGAQGVGRATTRAVVTASMAILISDFFLSKLILALWMW